MTNRTITDLRAAKGQLERTILDGIMKLEDQFGVTVESVYTRHSQDMSGRKQTVTTDVEVVV